jgi:hypothetical protein
MPLLSLVLLFLFSDVASAKEPFAPFARLTLLEDTDLSGSDYRAIKDGSLQDCRNACLKEEQCKAYTYNHGARYCFLKDKIPKRSPFKGASSGTKYIHRMIPTGPEPNPTTKQIVDTWLRSHELCREGSDDKPVAQAWCEVRDALGVVLELRDICYGKKDQAKTEFYWHQCEATSQRIKVPKSVSSIRGE